MICDACKSRPEWKGEHRCHTANGLKEMIVNGMRVFGYCKCPKCQPLSEKQLAEFRRKHRRVLGGGEP